MRKIEQALEIAKANLRSCYTNNGIITGSRGVYWSWDSFYASFGSLVIGDFAIVKKNLKLYLSHQSPNGNIPKRIAHPLYPFRYIGLPIKEDPVNQKPSFQSPYFTGASVSQSPVLIIAFYEYIKKTNDLAFLKQNIRKLEQIFQFLETKSYSNGLLRESVGGGWAESVLKRGAITYTNVCYARSLQLISKLEGKLGHNSKAKDYNSKYRAIRTAVNTILWDESRGGFYSDWRGLWRHHHFAADGNLLAVLWNIAGKEQTRKIDRQLDYLLEHSDTPLPLTSDKYYFWRIFLANRFGGIKDYHVAFSWLWLGSIASIVKYKLGQRKKALGILQKISTQIVNDRSVCEIYYRQKPVDVLLYKCERPWAWSAGMFIYTCSQLRKIL